MTHQDSMQARARHILRVTLTGFSVAAALGVAGQVQAQDKPAQAAKPADASPRAAFMRADANADGKLSATEAAAMPDIATNFVALDTDKDGALTPSEFMVAYKAPASRY